MGTWNLIQCVCLTLKLLAVNKSVCLDQNIVITIITFLSVTNIIS